MNRSEDLESQGLIHAASEFYLHQTLLRSDPTYAVSGIKTRSYFGEDYYHGNILNGRRHGHGHSIDNLGNSYTGPFIKNEPSGPNGQLTLQNGDLYVGSFAHNMMDGQGEFIEKKTGNKYVGGFRENKKFGQGVTYWQMAEEQMNLCRICYEEEQDAVFIDCGHMCACEACAKMVDTCPICRQNVVKVVKVFKT